MIARFENSVARRSIARIAESRISSIFGSSSKAHVTNASRRIKKSEADKCAKNGVTPVEAKIGFDGIVNMR